MTDAGGGLSKYKNVVLNVAVLGVAVFVSLKLFSMEEGKLNELKAQRDEEVKKNAVLGDISQLEQKIAAYKSFLNRKDVSRTIDVIGDIAKEAGVKIVSVKPQAESSPYKFVVKFPYDLTIDAPSYHALGKFVGSLESHQDVFTVENVVIKPYFAPPASAEEPRYKLTVSMLVSTIIYKE